jgi:hypothetical protein
MSEELIKAAQMALEALESASNGLTWYQQEHPEDDSPADEEMREALNQAMCALRTALTQASRPAEAVGEVWGWAVNSTLFRGEFAEDDANAESNRCGGTTRAVAIYTHPAPAVQADVLKDAQRYRWLRDNLEGDWAICEWAAGDYHRDARASHIVDAAIDAAMLNAAPPAPTDKQGVQG